MQAVTPVSQAWAQFDTAHTALLHALEQVRRAVAAEAGVRADDPCDAIIQLVARHYGLPPEALRSRQRTRELAQARHVAVWLCHGLIRPRLTLAAIGAAFGGRSHNTVLHALECVADRAATEPRFAGELPELRRRAEEALR
jgi:chromosomal replication initiation ATPase DnaA